MYKEDFDIIKAKSKTWTEGDWAISLCDESIFFPPLPELY